MRITFFIGNGFDLNQNLKTNYSDFLKNYLKETEADSPAVTEFKKRLNNYDCWSDLEIALGSMLHEYDEDSVDQYVSGLKDLKEKLSRYLAKEEKRFKYKIRKIKKELKRSIAIFYTKFGYLHPFDDLYPNNSEKNIINFVSFNYTRIVNIMLHKIRKKRMSLDWKNTENDIGTVLPVHGTTKTGFILGINDASQIGNPALQNNSTLHNYLIKKNQIDTMNRCSRAEKVDKIINNSDIIYVYGMSIGETDNMYWKTVCKWLNEDKKHLLIVNRFDSHFSSIDMGTISEKTDAFVNQLKSLGADDIAVGDQVYYITNATIFSFVKKPKSKRKR